MSTLLLDASVWLAAIEPDEEHHASARRLLGGAGEGAFGLSALDLTLYEVANVAAGRWRSLPLTELGLRLVLTGSAAIERVDAELLSSAAEIATEHGLSVYEGAYVAAARRRGWRLISLDVADLVTKGLAELPH